LPSLTALSTIIFLSRQYRSSKKVFFSFSMLIINWHQIVEGSMLEGNTFWKTFSPFLFTSLYKSFIMECGKQTMTMDLLPPPPCSWLDKTLNIAGGLHCLSVITLSLSAWVQTSLLVKSDEKGVATQKRRVRSRRNTGLTGKTHPGPKFEKTVEVTTN
jgi:hypothetical protein